MENVRGKEVNLVRTTVKIPGQRPRGSEGPRPAQSNGQSSSTSGVSTPGNYYQFLTLALSAVVKYKQLLFHFGILLPNLQCDGGTVCIVI